MDEADDRQERASLRLAVERQDVVPGETEAADGWSGLQASMRPMPIVSMQPGDQFFRSLIGGVVGVGIGPFTQSGLDEALGLAIGLGRVWPGEDLAEGEAFASSAERL